MLECISPYLRIKKEQANLALEFQEHMSSRVPLTDEVIAYREQVKQKMSALKR